MLKYIKRAYIMSVASTFEIPGSAKVLDTNKN
jgi:hypothetical protein